MVKKSFRLTLAAMMLIAAVASLGQAALAQDQREITCDGDLIVTAQVSTGEVGTSFRVNGSGPGLPTAGQFVPAGTSTTLTFVLPGPGAWFALFLEYSNSFTEGTWQFAEVPISASCGTVDEGAPGCDVYIPLTPTAVVGSFVATTEMFWKPGAVIVPPKVANMGQTAWVLGMDATLTYYKIVWACQLVWVPVPTMGPNFDAVWNGTPLPTNVVE